MNLVEKLFELERERSGSANRVRTDGKAATILHNDKKFYYVPDIVIKDTEKLNKALEKYLRAVRQSKLEFANYKGRHEDYVSYYLMYLYRNMTNNDYQDFTAYVNRYCQFIYDETFSEYDCRQVIGEYNHQRVFAQRISGERGTETPHIMQFSFEPYESQEDIYCLPFIRYGICDVYNQKTVEIFAIQRGNCQQEGNYVDGMEKMIRGVNTGLKEQRDVNPYFVAAMAMFIKMLHNEGIRNIIIPDIVSYRYGVFKKVTSEDERDRIQTNVTDKFMSLFLRLENQINGINIEAFPNDFDSFMHIKLDDNLHINNLTLQSLCSIKNVEYWTIPKETRNCR